MTNQLALAIAAYIDGKKQEKLAKLHKEHNTALKNAAIDTAKATLTSLYQRDIAALNDRFLPTNWLTDAARRASQITITTHPIKFTHSSAQGSSIWAEFSAANGESANYLASHTLINHTVLDVTGNAAALDVAGALLLVCEGDTLAEQIRRGDHRTLDAFARSDRELQAWVQGFEKALKSDTYSSHTYAKQVYFPVSPSDYHLLGPLFASSLAQKLHDKLQASRYSEEAKEKRQAKKEQRYHPEPCISYPRTAIQMAGGSKAQNVSLLNSRRGGKIPLLCCAPPHWRAVNRPPLKRSTLFGRELNRCTWSAVQALQTFLHQVQTQDSTRSIRQRRDALLREVIGVVLDYAAEIQALDAGWSVDKDCKLNRATTCWLDPRCPDNAFQVQRQTGDWQPAVAREFALWLNKQLEDKTLILDKTASDHWRKQFIEALRHNGTHRAEAL